ncbi:hypothetical protein F2Q68_00001325 [Brassica cretica]|uniref:Longin domain-containing protein n=1 Tax=Brassica cretica TaxID=69181 RepID=A0A8S9JBB9_BRACR|nr:hypothetical protein F2Q68_00001325 [Brassica cretica]
MSQQSSLIYSFVARGTVILVEFTDFKGNFTSIAAQCLQKLPSSNNKFTYNCDGHTFNYLVENGFNKRLIESGGLGNGPVKWFKAKSKIFTDEFSKTSPLPSKLLQGLKALQGVWELTDATARQGQIGSRIRASNSLRPRRRLSSLDEKEEFGMSIEPVRWFPVKSTIDKKGIMSREEGMFPEM